MGTSQEWNSSERAINSQLLAVQIPLQETNHRICKCVNTTGFLCRPNALDEGVCVYIRERGTHTHRSQTRNRILKMSLVVIFATEFLLSNRIGHDS